MWLRSPTPDATRLAGCLLGRVLRGEGIVLGLCGPLGAGKTLFVKGLAEGLGLDPQQVSSPTFVIGSEYPLEGGARLVHLDLYRLSSEAELLATGFLDWLAPGNVVAVEWSDRLPGVLPSEGLTLRFERVAGPGGGSQRRLDALASGPGAQALCARWWAEIAAVGSGAGLQVEPQPPAR